MDAQDLYEAILKALEAEHEDWAVNVKDGKCPSFDAYKHDTGYMEGLRKAADLAKATFRTFLHDDEEGDHDSA